MATTTYATLAQLKHALKVPEDDTTDDDEMTRVLGGASRAIDDAAGGRRFWLDDAPSARVYSLASRTTWVDEGQLILVDDIAASIGLVVEIGTVSGGWTPFTGYDTWPDNALALGRPITGLLHEAGWPIAYRQRVRVTARWGWPSVPEQITEACLIQTARLFRRKDSPEGVAGSSEWGPIRVSRVDPDVQSLVQHFALPGFG